MPVPFHFKLPHLSFMISAVYPADLSEDQLGMYNKSNTSTFGTVPEPIRIQKVTHEACGEEKKQQYSGHFHETHRNLRLIARQ